MKVLVTAHRPDETEIFEKANQKYHYELSFQTQQLTEENLEMARGYEAVCINAGCHVTEQMARRLKEMGVRYVLTRAAGKDHLDLKAVQKYGLRSANVPAYSPSAISEHTILLLLAVLRKLKTQLRRIDEKYFFITGLRGREIRDMTIGVIGTGRIGSQTVKDLSGFGCRLLACDQHPNADTARLAQYMEMKELLQKSDAVILHCPMTAENYHLISKEAIGVMKEGAVLVNTARGELVDTQAVCEALKCGWLSGLAMDVYEHENLTQRKDYRGKKLDDPLLGELLAMDNVVFTSHTAFYTDEAIASIVGTTLENLYEWETTGSCKNETR